MFEKLNALFVEFINEGKSVAFNVAFAFAIVDGVVEAVVNWVVTFKRVLLDVEFEKFGNIVLIVVLNGVFCVVELIVFEIVVTLFAFSKK